MWISIYSFICMSSFRYELNRCSDWYLELSVYDIIFDYMSICTSSVRNESVIWMKFCFKLFFFDVTFLFIWVTSHSSAKWTNYLKKIMLRDVHFSDHFQWYSELDSVIQSEQNISAESYYEVLIYNMIFDHVIQWMPF